MKNRDSLKTIVVGGGAVFILLVLCIAISLLVSVTSVRRTEPYQHSVDLALNSAAVREALGDPITVGRFPQGAVNTAVGGNAELYIPLHGAHTDASIRVNAQNINGTWQYYAIRVDTDDGDHIDLLEP